MPSFAAFARRMKYKRRPAAGLRRRSARRPELPMLSAKFQRLDTCEERDGHAARRSWCCSRTACCRRRARAEIAGEAGLPEACSNLRAAPLAADEEAAREIGARFLASPALKLWKLP